MTERLEELSKSTKLFVSEDNGIVSVNWKSLFNLSMMVIKESIEPYWRRNDELMDYIFEYLQERGLLLPEGTPGSYIATGKGGLMSMPVKHRIGDRQVLSFSNEKIS